MNNKDLKKFYTPFLLLGWVVLMIGMIAMVSYAGGRDKAMNEIALEATQPSFYDTMIAEGKLEPKQYDPTLSPVFEWADINHLYYFWQDDWIIPWCEFFIETNRDGYMADNQNGHDYHYILGSDCQLLEYEFRKRVQNWLYYEPQAPKATCISTYDRWLDDRVQYAYDLGGIDFVGTIAQESMFDPSAVGDQWNSFWFCQLHAYWHSDKIREYKALGTNEAKLEYCYKVYKGYIDAGNIQNRLYGYNVRQNGLAKLGITCE